MNLAVLFLQVIAAFITNIIQGLFAEGGLLGGFDLAGILSGLTGG